MGKKNGSRLKQILPDEMSPEQRAMYDHIFAGPRGESFKDLGPGLPGPFGPWIYAPPLCQAIEKLGTTLRFEGSLDARLRELAICVVSGLKRASLEFGVHSELAREAGVSDAIIEAIRAGGSPDFEKDDERVVYDFAVRLISEHQVDDATYEALVAELGEEGAVELVVLLGFYSLVSMTLNAFQVPLFEGMEDPFD